MNGLILFSLSTSGIMSHIRPVDPHLSALILFVSIYSFRCLIGIFHVVLLPVAGIGLLYFYSVLIIYCTFDADWIAKLQGT